MPANLNVASHPWLRTTTTVNEYVPPSYYDQLLRPYVFEPGTDLDILRTHVEERPAPPLQDVLELGIGTGRVCDSLLDLPSLRSYRAVDLSRQMIAACREKYQGYPIVGLVQSDTVQYLLDCDEDFDFVCSLWSMSHSVHQNLLFKEDGADRVHRALWRLATTLLRPGRSFFLIHVDVLSDEQQILARQWNRVQQVFTPGEQSPSKQRIDRVLAELEEAGHINFRMRHLIGTPIRYPSLEEAMETFLNFHLESFFNGRPDLPEVYQDVESHLRRFSQPDGTIEVAPGCFVYEVTRTAHAPEATPRSSAGATTVARV